jgi:hypothetical protein
MSETAPEAPTEDVSQEEAPDQKTFDADYVKKLRAESAKHRTEANKALKALAEIQDRDKTELQKAQERAAELEKAAQNHELTALRLQIAFDKGLTPAQAKRLVGTTRDELEADADEVLANFTPRDARRPSGSVDQGTRGKPLAADPRQAFADLLTGKTT